MPQASTSRQKLVRVAQSLLIGAVGGFLFNAAKFPAGWLAGSMVFAAAAALAGRQIHVPSPLARLCSVVLGIAIGGVVTGVRLIEGGYAVELAVPWNIFNLTPFSGEGMAFTLSVSDDDSPGRLTRIPSKR